MRTSKNNFMNKVKAIVLFLLMTIANKLIAQKPSTYPVSINGLTIGNRVPDIPISNIVNFPMKEAKISDFRGKLLILDFWATWCSPCIAAFMKNDSLQKKFRDQIQIMPVTKESEQKVQDFFGKMGRIKSIMPPSATYDFKLNNYFKHVYLPHYAWIDKDGMLIAITDQKEVNELNIKKVLSGEMVDFEFKKDILTTFIEDQNRPFFTTGIMAKVDTTVRLLPLEDSQLVKRSIFTRAIDGVLGGTRTSTPEIVIAQNVPIRYLYNLAFWGDGMNSLSSTDNWTKIEIKDAKLYEIVRARRQDGSRLVQPGNESLEFIKKYGYCYELVVPDFLEKGKYDIMLKELNEFFGPLYNIEGVKEKRKMKYLGLVRISKEDKLASKGGDEIDKADKFSIKLQNEDLNSLLWALVVPLQGQPPMQDETNYKGKVDIELNCSLSDLKAVNNELAKYGLQLQEKEKVVEVGVIRDKIK
jgi:thiol-disulfide isomerase/thioredoxin